MFNISCLHSAAIRWNPIPGIQAGTCFTKDASQRLSRERKPTRRTKWRHIHPEMRWSASEGRGLSMTLFTNSTGLSFCVPYLYAIRMMKPCMSTKPSKSALVGGSSNNRYTWRRCVRNSQASPGGASGSSRIHPLLDCGI
jgi:hypothetical protein